MTKKLVKKHDPLARKFLTDITVAKEFLNLYLEPKILELCDLSSLEIDSGSYVEEDLKVHFSDVVYKVNLKENAGCVYIYNLVEHQSSPEKLMPLRIIRYQLAIIQKHLDKYGEGALPLVVPMVFYNGSQSPYPYPYDIADLFFDKELFDQVQLGKFRLIDLTVMPQDEILRHGKIAVLEMLAKYIHVRDIKAVLEYIIASINVARAHGLTESLFKGAFTYLSDAREISEMKLVVEQLIKTVPEYREIIMTYSESLRQEGELRGKLEGKLEIAKELLKSGIDNSIIANATHLSLEEIKKLKNSLH